MFGRKTARAALLLALWSGSVVGAARAAEPWPVRPVRIVVPFSASGTADLLARIVADRLGSAFGQSFVIENRPGAGGIIGQEQVARGPTATPSCSRASAAS